MLYGAGSRSLDDSCLAGLLLRGNVLRRRVSGIGDAFFNFLLIDSNFLKNVSFFENPKKVKVQHILGNVNIFENHILFF